MPEITMPRLSDSMEEGTILKWLVSEGDEVSQGQEIAEIETDKATMTYEADEAGVFHPVAGEGDTLPIGEVIATIGEDAPKGGDGAKPAKDEAEDEEPDEERAEPKAEKDQEPAEEPEPEPEPERRKEQGRGNGAGPDGRVKASPVARRLAKEQGVELGSIEGTGPGGRIVKADVEKAASGEAPKTEPKEDGKPREKEREREPEPAAAASAASPGTSEPKVTDTGTTKGDVSVAELTRTQQVVARRMAEAKATIPDFTLTTEVDMEECVGLRARLKEIAGEDTVVPSFNDMVVKASAAALRDHPRANGSYKDGRFELYSRVNVGVAVAAQNSLVVPVIHDADQKSMGHIARDMRKLAARVRDGTVSPPELAGGTFTVSNLGMYGITEFTAVINPPQAAILAVGTLERKPVVVDDRGKIEARHRMRLSLVCDHRILYGADAAEFLGRIRALLEEPLALAL
ncbi:MAG TPA: dihydrolipoamide acetyltransferase family protein [Solirubrobacteraceae bacterium]|nr:dihydrolipoamide acetyltransferase family protein [Solirubrobacteraceae bacterium]